MFVKVLQSLIFGLFQGCLYGIMGFGLSLIFSTVGVMNFAHGNSGMIGVFFGWTVLFLTKNIFLAFLAAIISATILAIFIDKALMKRVKGLSHSAMLIITLGLLLIFEGLAVIIWGTQPLIFPEIFGFSPKIVFLPQSLNKSNIPLIIPGNDLAVFGTIMALLLLLIVFFKYSKPGLAVQARSEDEIGARVIGINTQATDTLSWIFGIATAVFAGLLIAPKTTVNPNMLTNLQFYGFTAAVFGGFSSIVGAMAGGLILGVIEKLVILGLDELFLLMHITSINAVDLQLSIVLLCIIVTLIVKPTGLFGNKYKGKV